MAKKATGAQLLILNLVVAGRRLWSVDNKRFFIDGLTRGFPSAVSPIACRAMIKAGLIEQYTDNQYSGFSQQGYTVAAAGIEAAYQSRKKEGRTLG